MIILQMKRKHPPLYYRKRVAAGPLCTSKISEAKRFATEEEGLREAYDPIRFWDAVPAPETVG